MLTIDNPSTMRGHTAAWKRLHTIEGQKFPEKDRICKMLQQSNRLALPPQTAPKRMAKEIATKVLRVAARRAWVELGVMISWGYQYLSRIHNELIKQGTTKTMQVTAEGTRLGPIKRKNRPNLVTMERSCLCKTKHAVMCPCKWLQTRIAEIMEQEAPISEGQETFTEYTHTLLWQMREALWEAGEEVDMKELKRWTFHTVRKGAALDVLQKRSTRPSTGGDQMLKEGDWKAPKSAYHYVTQEEFEQAIMEEADDE